jgi:outer membrane protein assembly factor BamD
MRNILTLLAVAVLAGCGSGNPQLSGFDGDQLLAYGIERMEAEKWDDAARAFETFIFQYPTHPQYQEVRFRLGEVYYEREDYLSAASEFARLADDFPAGDLADDARYRVCRAYSEVSPGPQLDQEYTRTAITHCESLLGYYPNSEFATEARELIARLRNKLAEKVFMTGRNYLRQGYYDSAIIYFDDVVDQFPGTGAAPKALAALFEAYTEIGYTEDATAAKERLLRDYPESEEARRLGGAAADSS